MLLSSLQRLGAACGLQSLGRSGSMAVAALPSSSAGLWLRSFSDEAAGSEKPAEEPAAAASGSGGEAEPAAAAPAVAAAGEESAAAASAEEPAPAGPVIEDFSSEDMSVGTAVPRELFSKRQLAWMGVAEDQDTKYKHFLPKLSRKETGSFADEYVSEEFDVEQELYPTIPEDTPLYDLRKVVPEAYKPRSELFERLQRLRASQPNPDMPIGQFVREVLGMDSPEEAPPRPGARRIIRWQIRHVMAVGVQEGHPASKRVRAWVYLRDLQREYGLTDAALQHIAAICGERYNPNRGELRLSSDRYPHREANRAHIRQILDDLVAEGHRKHPAPKQQQQAEEQQQEQSAAAVAAP